MDRRSFTFPQASNSGLPDIRRKAFLAWIDPIAIARSMQGDDPASGMASK